MFTQIDKEENNNTPNNKDGQRKWSTNSPSPLRRGEIRKVNIFLQCSASL